MNDSQARKRLQELTAQIAPLVELAQERAPLWRGLVREVRRKCGRPNCHCARGELHPCVVLADRSGEKQRNFTLEGLQLRLFAGLTEKYRAVRKARARFVRITREMLALFDHLEELRRREAVRRHGAKLPPPRKAGKPP